MNVTIKGGIYYNPDHNEWSPKYKFFSGTLSGFSGYIPIKEHEFSVELPAGFDPRVEEVKALEAMREEAQRKFTKTVCDINERISKLQCIEYAEAV